MLPDEMQKGLDQALAKLSPEHRTVLILKDIEHRKYAEVSGMLKLPIDSVRIRLHRARLEFREILEKDGKG